MSKNIFIGNQNVGGILLPYENALIYYVYGRTCLNSEGFLSLLPSIFHFFHHSIEVSIKTALQLKGITYPNRSMEGHRIYGLFLIAIKSKSFSKRFNDLDDNSEIKDVLKVMDNSYMNNKYDYPGYMINLPLLDCIDEIIFVLFEEINFMLGAKKPKHALAKLYIPEPVEKSFLHKLKMPFTYTILNIRED
jgi:hypothetical protein